MSTSVHFCTGYMPERVLLGQAGVVVSAAFVSVDRDLLDLEPDDLTICSPRVFLDMLAAGES